MLAKFEELNHHINNAQQQFLYISQHIESIKAERLKLRKKFSHNLTEQQQNRFQANAYQLNGELEVLLKLQKNYQALNACFKADISRTSIGSVVAEGQEAEFLKLSRKFSDDLYDGIARYEKKFIERVEEYAAPIIGVVDRYSDALGAPLHIKKGLALEKVVQTIIDEAQALERQFKKYDSQFTGAKASTELKDKVRVLREKAEEIKTGYLLQLRKGESRFPNSNGDEKARVAFRQLAELSYLSLEFGLEAQKPNVAEVLARGSNNFVQEGTGVMERISLEDPLDLKKGVILEKTVERMITEAQSLQGQFAGYQSQLLGAKPPQGLTKQLSALLAKAEAFKASYLDQLAEGDRRYPDPNGDIAEKKAFRDLAELAYLSSLFEAEASKSNAREVLARGSRDLITKGTEIVVQLPLEGDQLEVKQGVILEHTIGVIIDEIQMLQGKFSEYKKSYTGAKPTAQLETQMMELLEKAQAFRDSYLVNIEEDDVRIPDAKRDEAAFGALTELAQLSLLFEAQAKDPKNKAALKRGSDDILTKGIGVLNPFVKDMWRKDVTKTAAKRQEQQPSPVSVQHGALSDSDNEEEVVPEGLSFVSEGLPSFVQSYKDTLNKYIRSIQNPTSLDLFPWFKVEDLFRLDVDEALQNKLKSALGVTAATDALDPSRFNIEQLDALKAELASTQHDEGEEESYEESYDEFLLNLKSMAIAAQYNLDEKEAAYIEIIDELNLDPADEVFIAAMLTDVIQSAAKEDDLNIGRINRVMDAVTVESGDFPNSFSFVFCRHIIDAIIDTDLDNAEKIAVVNQVIAETIESVFFDKSFSEASIESILDPILDGNFSSEQKLEVYSCMMMKIVSADESLMKSEEKETVISRIIERQFFCDVIDELPFDEVIQFNKGMIDSIIEKSHLRSKDEAAVIVLFIQELEGILVGRKDDLTEEEYEQYEHQLTGIANEMETKLGGISEGEIPNATQRFREQLQSQMQDGDDTPDDEMQDSNML
ncbi:MAG: hypothetical protein K0U37_08610 [Gammaproteobacteria bacterium]|nr:hypothetical protein [Gammaproteobacteria bacterium]